MESLDKLEDELEELNDKYQERQIPFRFNPHVDVVRKLAESALEVGELFAGENDEDDIPEGELNDFQNWVSLIRDLIEILNEKAESTHTEYEEAIEAIGLEFYNRCNRPNISTPLVLISDDLNDENSSNIPVFDIKDEEGEPEEVEFDKQKDSPFIAVSTYWKEEPRYWPLITHEFSHVLHESEGPINNPEGHHAYVSEFFSDKVASTVLGPTYLQSMIEYNDENEELLGATQNSHPAPSSRINAVTEHLYEMADGDVRDHIEEIKMDWLDREESSALIKEDRAHRRAGRHFDDFIDSGTLTEFNEMWVRAMSRELNNSPLELLTKVIYSDEEISLSELKDSINSWYDARR